MSLGEVQRRTVLKGAVVLAAAGLGVSGARTASAQQVPFSTGTERPKTTAPANATDCLMHIYDKRFSAAPNATLLPPDALPDDYRKLQQRIGTRLYGFPKAA